MADVSSVHALENLWEEQRKSGGQIYFTGLQPQVERIFERTGLKESIGDDKFFWGADQAIMAVSKRTKPKPRRDLAAATD